MAPKRARSSASQDGERELVKLLAARLTRADLEALVVTHVGSGLSIKRADLETRLPERMQARDAKPVVVRAGRSRQGTGRFDELDDELLVKILAHLGPRARVRAVSRVCKAWRGMRGCTELWSDIDDEQLPLHGLQGFLGWLPAQGKEVRKATVRADKDVHVKSPLALLAKLPSLTELTLSGPKITANALAAAASTCGATLRSLRLYDVKDTQSTHLDTFAVAAAAKQMPLLEVLELPSSLLDKAPLAVLSALAEARGGGSPLLRELIVGSSGYHSISAQGFLSVVGKALPELEVLRVYHIDFEDFAANAAWAPMPRLRALTLEEDTAYGYGILLTTDKLGGLLDCAFSAAPNLEAFEVEAGHQWIPPSDRKVVRPPPPLALAGALQLHPPPPSLRSLSLRKITLSASDLDDLDLPNLRMLTLCSCGPHAKQAASALASKYPPGTLVART